MVAGILLQNLVHLIAALSLLGGLDGLGIAVLQVLDAFIVRVESGDHAANRFYLLDEFLIYLVLSALLLLIVLFMVQIVFGRGTPHQRGTLPYQNLTDLSS